MFNDKLQEWEDYCNYHRPHGALDGQTPYRRLLAKKSLCRSVTGGPKTLQLIDGSPGRIRTADQRINSPSLYH